MGDVIGSGIPANKEGSRVGILMVIFASIISLIGVCYNNLALDHHMAMIVWRWSNIVFAIYFFGRWRRWWDGGLSDFVMMCLYGFYVITNEIGLEGGG